MAVITLDYTNTLKETAANDGTVGGSVVITLAESTFAGTDGGTLPGATVDNVPAGLTAVLVKTDDTHATLTFTGKATAHGTDIANLTVTLTEDSFATGADLTDVALAKSDLLIDFDAPAGGEPEADPNAPEEAFGGPLLITSVKDTTGDNVGKLEKVTLTGYAATPGVGLTLFNGTKKLEDKVTVNEDGTWTASFTPAKAGVYNLSVKETFTDNSGTTAKTLYGGPSNTVTYTADDKVPPSAKVDKFKLPTADTTPTITGKAEKLADVTVTIKKDAVTHTLTTKANDKGVWALTDEDWFNGGNPIELAAGDWKITAKATDAAGNTSAADSKEEIVTVDTEVTTFTVTKGFTFSDTAKTWATKTFSSQKLEGKADANSVIQFFGGPDGSVPLGKPVKVNKSGDWKATLKLTDGKHVVSALVTDQAGNQKTYAELANEDLGIAAAAGLDTITVDSFAPIVTVKKETTPSATTFTGSVEYDAVKVEVFNGTTLLGTATIDAATGTWSFTNPQALTGKVKISAKATDAAGNVSKPSAAVTYDFKEAAGGGDTTPPTISEFIVASATTLTLKSNEAGKAGLYNDDGGALIGTEVTLVKDTTSPAITVAAQGSMTIASLKVADAVPNTATSTTKVLLGTAGGDGGATFTVGAGDQYIFTFAGNDTITFTSAAASGRVIADFTAGGDKIALTGTAFAGITDNAGLLQAADFSSGAGKVAAASATELIIYDTDTGNLYYDAGGNAGADAVLIAKLVGAPTVTAADFLVA